MDPADDDCHVQGVQDGSKGSSKLAAHGFSPTVGSSTSGPQATSSVEYDLQHGNVTLLKLTSHDRELLAKELKRSMASHLVMDSAYKQSGPASLESTLLRNYPVSTSDRSLSSGGGVPPMATATNRDYDGLREQCERAMHELQSLRRQHNETLRKCDQAVKECEYYRSQQRLVSPRLDSLNQELGALRSKYNEVLAERQRLEQTVKSLQKFREEDRKEVAELRRQQQEAMNADTGGAAETLHALYVGTVQKYEAIKDEYNTLRDRYADLHGSHSEAMSKLELAREELGRLKKQYEDMAAERNSAIRERNGLKQQCTAAIRQWDTALRERNEFKEALAKVQQQHEEAVKEINQAMAVRIKAGKDLKRLTEERNAAMHEYSLVMSERDTVHKEMEKLTDDLNQAAVKNKSIDQKNKEFVEERKTLLYQVETLKREITSALHDRDKALKECNDLREKFGERLGKEDYHSGALSSHKDPGPDHTSSSERDDASRKKDGSSESQPNSQKKENRVDDLDQANQEIERLRKQVDKLQAELQEATQEAEVSKRRRDWAFSERDKIVLERESIRTLCDKLRRERDRAVSDLAEALRDSDDIKKQRNEASKELKELREKLEAQLEKESCMKQQLQAESHNHSRDSAIDTDMHEWEVETLEIDLSGLSSTDNIGFDLSVSRDDSHFPSDGCLFVSSVSKGSVADGLLKINDCLVRVNNIDCANINVDKRQILEAARSNHGTLHVVVRRRRPGGPRCVYTTQLHLSPGQDHGLTFESGLYISKITPGSAAAKEGTLAVGDRLLSVNGRPIESFRNIQEVANLFDESCSTTSGSPSSSQPLLLTLLKPSGVSRASSSGGVGNNANVSPAKEPSSNGGSKGSREFLRKLIHSGSQTDDSPSKNSNYRSSKGSAMLSGLGSSGSSEKSGGSSQHSHHHSTGPWELLREKIDIVRGKAGRHGKSHKQQSDSMQKQQPSQQQPVKEKVKEEDALAELDSVINAAYHPKQNSTSKRVKRKERAGFFNLQKGDTSEKNVGTWPKCRAGANTYTAGAFQQLPGGAIVHNTGTVMLHPRRHKERLPLSLLWPGPDGIQMNQDIVDDVRHYDDEDPMTSCSDGQVLHHHHHHHHHRSRAPAYSLYKSFDGNVISSHLKAAHLFAPGQGPSVSSDVDRRSPMDGKGGSGSNSTAQSQSRLSIDLSVKSGNVGKEVLEYYVKNKNSVGGRHSQSDGESGMSSSGYASAANKPSAELLDHRLIHGRVSSPSAYYPASASVRSPLATLPHYSTPPTFMHHQHHSHPHGSLPVTTSNSPSPRYSFPSPVPQLPLTTSQSGESILSSPESRSYSFEAPYGTSAQLLPYHHSPSPSMELHYHHQKGTSSSRMTPPHHLLSQAMHPSLAHPHGSYPTRAPSSGAEDIVLPPYQSCAMPQVYEGGTYPRKKDHHHHHHHHQRIRIPSNQSVTSKSSAGRISSGSIERSLERGGSPTSPHFHVEVLSSGTGNRFSECPWPKKPTPGQVRRIQIDKSSEPLGIQISCLSSGGVFVSSVTEHSLASQAGLQVGDQLLEVCGINLRIATYDLAASVLRQCGDAITMLVQYSPEKYHELEDSGSVSGSGRESSSDGESSSGGASSDEEDDEDDNGRGSPTPCNSPKPSPRNVDGGGSPARSKNEPTSSAHGTLTRHQRSQAVAALDRQTGVGSPDKMMTYDPRYVMLETKKASNLGISLVGGNAVGIFVHSVQPESPAHNAGLRTGDQLLEYNGANLKRATAEEAAYELAKPADKVSILAKYNIDRYNEIKDQPGDGFYIRVLFDRLSDSSGGLLVGGTSPGSPDASLHLRFRKDDILFVDNTMFNGVPGHWRAWKVDEDGLRRQWGIIPSKYKVEEELLLKRSLGELDADGTRRVSTLARRSFFRRKKHFQNQHRSTGSSSGSSRDSKELASFSDISINSYADPAGSAVVAGFDEPVISSYQRVERLDYLVLRPLLIVGPLSECVVDRLVQDFPHKFSRCIPEVMMHCAPTTIEKGLADNIFVDYRRKGNHFECTTVAAVREMCDKSLHCVLDVSMVAVERLHRRQIYPIVLLVKFKNTKQIREVKDTRCLGEKVSAKAAKEMYEHALKIEAEYRHLISAVIPAGVNVAYMCTQIKAAVEQEQRKTLWVPSSSPI